MDTSPVAMKGCINWAFIKRLWLLIREGPPAVVRDFGFRDVTRRTARLSRLTQQIRGTEDLLTGLSKCIDDCVVFYTVSAIFQPYHGDIVKTGVVS